MRLLDRYLLRELLVPLFYCLIGFLILWIFSDLFTQLGDFQKKKLVARDLIAYYAVSSIDVLSLLLPLALLLALLYALTNHARHHELTAIRAAGIGTWRYCLPYFGVGLCAVVLLFLLNEVIAPDSSERAQRILTRHITKGAMPNNLVANLGFTNERDKRKWQIGVYNMDTGEMSNPKIIWTQADGSSRWISADKARRENGQWVFYNYTEHLEGSGSNSLLVAGTQTNRLALPEITETPDEIRSEVRLARGISMTRARKADIPLTEIMQYLRFHPRLSRSDRAWVFTRLHARIAAPLTCLVVVLIAIPFGAASGRRNVFVGIASSLVLAFAYFVTQQICLAIGTGGTVSPAVAAWAPNVFFALTGMILMARLR